MIGKLSTVALDAPDHRALAQFYADLTGGQITDSEEDWVSAVTPDGWLLGFQAAPDHVPPRWPDPEAPQQMHLDLRFPDIDEARTRAEALGATQLGGGETWHVMADPAGHPFCICKFEEADPSAVFAVTIDTEDPKTLGQFYADMLGMEIQYDGDEGMLIGAANGPMSAVMFQKIADHRAPRWPDPSAPQQLHLDIEVDDIDEAEPKVLALGATKLDSPVRGWRVYADPAGHPFCLVFDE